MIMKHFTRILTALPAPAFCVLLFRSNFSGRDDNGIQWRRFNNNTPFDIVKHSIRFVGAILFAPGSFVCQRIWIVTKVCFW